MICSVIKKDQLRLVFFYVSQVGQAVVLSRATAAMSDAWCLIPAGLQQFRLVVCQKALPMQICVLHKQVCDDGVGQSCSTDTQTWYVTAQGSVGHGGSPVEEVNAAHGFSM